MLLALTRPQNCCRRSLTSITARFTRSNEISSFRFGTSVTRCPSSRAVPILLCAGAHESRLVCACSVTNVLKHWVEHYFRDFQENQELLQTLSQFVNEHLMVQYRAVAMRIHQLIHKRPHSYLQAPLDEGEINVVTKLGACPFLEFDPLEVAKQLTLIDFTRFKTISYAVFLLKKKRRTSKRARRRRERLTQIVVTVCVSV